VALAPRVCAGLRDQATLDWHVRLLQDVVRFSVFREA
jgi:hypothetical protein